MTDVEQQKRISKILPSLDHLRVVLDASMVAAALDCLPDITRAALSRGAPGGNVHVRTHQYLTGCILEHGASDKNVQQAVSMMNECVSIRDLLKLDTLLEPTFFPAEFVSAMTKSPFLSVLGNDRWGVPAVLFHLPPTGMTNFTFCWELGDKLNMLKSSAKPGAPTDDRGNLCLLWYASLIEFIMKTRYADLPKDGLVFEADGIHVVHPKIVVVIDCDSLGVMSFGEPLRRFLRGMISIGKVVYCETTKRMICLNVPWMAEKLYGWIKSLLPAKTAVKISMADRSSAKDVLDYMFPKESMPYIYGGTFSPVYFPSAEISARKSVQAALEVGPSGTPRNSDTTALLAGDVVHNIVVSTANESAIGREEEHMEDEASHT